MADTRLLDKNWRISNLYVIRNKNQELVRFSRNRAQRDFQSKKHTRNLILKSRQLGFTTDEAIDSLDDTLFTKNMECLLIAHNLDAGKAIFDKKIELAWDNLHPDLKKLYTVDSNTAQTLKFGFGDGSFSSVAVDTSGRSGTYNRVHITEFADICKRYPEKAREIIEGTIPAIPTYGRLDIESTSQGASGEFFEMFMEAWNRGEPTLPIEYKAHFYNWTFDEEIDLLVPLTNLPKDFKDYQVLHKLSDKEITYYYYKWTSLNKDWNALHREYPTTPEEAFEAIVEGTFYGVEMGMLERDGRSTILPHDPALPVHTVWDLGIGKNLVVGFYQKDKITGFLRKIDYWQGDGSDGLPEAIRNIKEKKYTYGKHFAPHDIQSTDVSTGKTRIEYAKSFGITFTLVPDVSVDDGINSARLMLSKLIIDREKCKEWVKSMKNYTREWDEKRGMYKETPFHNWASHGADEWRYASLCYDLMTNESEVEIQKMYFPNIDEIQKNLPRADDYKL